MINRRNFLFGTSLATAGVAIAYGGFGKRIDGLLTSGSASSLKAVGFGELVPTAAANTGETFLALPPGFKYNVIGKIDNMMTDGNKTPRRHDGMATFKVGSELRIVRNHEITNGGKPNDQSPIGSNPYDPMAGGGTTTLVIDPKTREIVRDFVSLSGTLVNCAGGPTPWGSWISCEETTWGPTVRANGSGGFAKPHGYCFEVFASANSSVSPVPLKEMGRFVHEAIAVDRKTGVVYLTEDANSSGFYRFLPKRNKRLVEGGELQMLKIDGSEPYDTRRGQKNGASFTTSWVKIDDPDPEIADVDDIAVYKQGLAKGAATFARLEGIDIDRNGRVFFTATSGGDAKAGQVWMYEPTGKDTGKLTLAFESPSRSVLDMPDNICLAPKSDLLFICEDSDYAELGGTPDNYVRILTPDGKLADFAKNITLGKESSEFAGSTFSPDGKTLFVNLQTIGITLAIWGDWKSFRS